MKKLLKKSGYKQVPKRSIDRPLTRSIDFPPDDAERTIKNHWIPSRLKNTFDVFLEPMLLLL